MTSTARQRELNNHCMAKRPKRESLDEVKAKLFDLRFHACVQTTTEAECALCAERHELEAAKKRLDTYGERQNFNDHY